MGESALAACELPSWTGQVVAGNILTPGLKPLDTNGPYGILLNILTATGSMVAGYTRWTEPDGSMRWEDLGSPRGARPQSRQSG